MAICSSAGKVSIVVLVLMLVSGRLRFSVIVSASASASAEDTWLLSGVVVVLLVRRNNALA
jgi:hypothetical protein